MYQEIVSSFRLMFFLRRKIKQGLLLTVSILAIFTLISQSSYGATTPYITLPRVTADSLVYMGGFRLPTKTLGDSLTAYVQGPITLGPDSSTIYMVGHIYDQAIGQFGIPAIVNSTTIGDFNTASVLQNYSKVLDRPETGNPQLMDRIGGMEYVNGKLVVNTYEYFDSPLDDTYTTLVVDDASKISTSAIKGYYGYDVKTHAAQWISPIPTTLQQTLGGTYITGESSGEPIIARHSVGPSAFAITPSTQIFGATKGATLPTSTLMDFSQANPMGLAQSGETYDDYMHNNKLDNTMWNHVSHASYAFIIPGTRTYMALGFSGGNVGGIGYKIVQDNGVLCAGFCSLQAADNYNYYWLFDLNDLIDVKNGKKQPYDVVPYAYGKFVTPFDGPGDALHIIKGGAIDPSKNILYLTMYGADTIAGNSTPLIIAYKLPILPDPPSGLSVQ